MLVHFLLIDHGSCSRPSSASGKVAQPLEKTIASHSGLSILLKLLSDHYLVLLSVATENSWNMLSDAGRVILRVQI